MFTSDTVDFEIKIEAECIPIEGNVLVSGDDEQDREAEQWVRDQLASGNDLSWCSVTVIARPKSFRERVQLGENCSIDPPDVQGWDHLGACSYETQKDLEADLLPGMKERALDCLNTVVEWLQAELAIGKESSYPPHERPWKATHRITFRSGFGGDGPKQVWLVWLHDEGSAYTRDEWYNDDAASWGVDEGRWYCEGQATPGGQVGEVTVQTL